MLAQKKIKLTGSITDNSGKMIIGANVNEKGTKNNVTTDIDGKFSIETLNPNAKLLITFVGYQTQEINTEGKSNFDIVLIIDSQTLQEIVVVGYGTAKKKDLTGSVSSINSESITKRNVTNAIEAIQGSVPGVQITAKSGRIGDGFDVVIRGANSLNGSKPLYVVDGVPLDGIDFLNPQDIARIDVLKDASSAAIYGSRGASGVVIVTTKSGTSAKSGISISYETSYGTKNVSRLPKMMSGEKWWYYHQSAFLGTINLNNPMAITPVQIEANTISTHSPLLKRRVDENNTFDWYDAVLKTGMTQNNYLSVSGRSDSGMSYNLGLGAQSETGNVDHESLNKYTFKVLPTTSYLI